MRLHVPLWLWNLLWGGFDVTLGLVLLLGGPERTSAASFAAVSQFPGVRAWGVAFLLLGLVLLAWRSGLARPWRRSGLRLVYVAGAALHAFWAASLAASAFDLPGASLTGPCVYTAITLAHALVSVCRVE